jgi:hypothetical protein
MSETPQPPADVDRKRARLGVLRTGVFLMLMIVSFPTLADTAALPGDVRAFISRRNDCDHFRGEASPDADRQGEIDRELVRLCKGSDAELARLLRHYRKSQAVLDALDDYERIIETSGEASKTPK